MKDEIGNFEIGKRFDALIIDIDVTDGTVDCLEDYEAKEVLQKFIYVGDDRNVVNVYVDGKLVKGQKYKLFYYFIYV